MMGWGGGGGCRRHAGFKHHNSSTLVHAHTRLRELAGSTRLPTRTFQPGEFLIRQGERAARCNSVRVRVRKHGTRKLTITLTLTLALTLILTLTPTLTLTQTQTLTLTLTLTPSQGRGGVGGVSSVVGCVREHAKERRRTEHSCGLPEARASSCSPPHMHVFGEDRQR